MIAILGIYSCGDKTEVDSKQLSTELNKPHDDATRERDEKFMVQAQEINLEGIMMGKIGQQRASSEEVRAMAKILEDAYRTAKSDLSSLALRKSIAVPSTATPKILEMVDQLNAKSVDEFDKEYCALVMNSQKDAIRHFEIYTDGISDAEIRSWALAMLPIIRSHHTRATELDAHYNQVSSRL